MRKIPDCENIGDFFVGKREEWREREKFGMRREGEGRREKNRQRGKKVEEGTKGLVRERG